MNTRIYSVIAVLTLMSFSTGCSGFRSCLFGRGARCGLCNRSAAPTPLFGNTMQAPYGPQASGPQASCGAPACQSRPQVGCGYNAAPGYSGQSCGCGGGVSPSGPATCDPYMSGGVAIPPNGQSVIPGQSDNFTTRNKFDNDGSRIIWEDPSGV